MADISLRDYLEKVDILLRTGKSDEVVLHTRQILNFYPKNAAASRYLGQALVRGTDFREAEPILRRVLAVYPDDGVAHSALSDLNERLGKPEEAIWHLERALEATPNDPALVEKWNGLYRRYRGIENPRFQLTTAAVARQYIRNTLYTEAIDALRTTLESAPNRVDLRLLLAQTLWNAGMEVEAGETALDVIDTLPYCLEANRILTLLWLEEGRPSDAQRYLNQIQEVEPYLALRLAQDSPPADNAFMVPELDYRRIAETQMAAEQPDWLSEIDHEELPQDALQATDLVLEDEAETFDEEMPSDFLTDLETGEELPQGTSTGSGFTGLLAALGRPDTIEDDDEDVIANEELPDWLTEAAPVEAVEEEPPEIAESDPLDWLAADDSEVAFDDESAATPDFFADMASTEIPLEMEASPDAVNRDEDPLAWLEGSGVELIDESEQVPLNQFLDDEEMIYQDPESVDPLAWLEGSGIEVTADETAPTGTPASDSLPEMPATGDLDWLQSPAEAEGDISTLFAASADAEDSMDWLQVGDPPEMSEHLEAFAMLPAEETEADQSLDWLRDDSMLDEMLDLEALSDEGSEDAASLEPEPESSDQSAALFEAIDRATRTTDRLPEHQDAEDTDWQSEMNDELKPDSQSDDSEPTGFEQPEADGQGEPAGEELEWLTEVSDEEEPDWLSEEAGEVEAELEEAAGEPEWLAEETAEEETALGEFEWLTEEQPEAELDEALGDEVEVTLDWGEGEGEPGAEPAADMPDWLTGAAPITDEADAGDEALEDEGEEAFDWFGSEDKADTVTDMPDWLSAVTPAAGLEAALDDEIEPEAEPAADMPDWLSEAAPITDEEPAEEEAEPEMGAAFDWLSGDEEAEALTDEAPDWLAAIAPAEAELADAEIEPEAEPAADMPDWLSEAAPITDEEPAEEEAEPEMGAAFDWLSGDEEAEALTEAAPDWLAAIAPAEAELADAEIEPEVEPATDMPDWLSEAAPLAEEELAEEAAEPEMEAAFDWLSGDEEAEALTEAAPDWLAEAEVESELAGDNEIEPQAEPVAEMPDWLAEAAPLAEDEPAEEEAEPEMEAAFDWLSGDEDAEALTEEAADWLVESELAEEQDAVEWVESDEAVEPAAELPGWLADDEEDEVEVASLSDWLADADLSNEEEIGEEESIAQPPAATLAQTRILPENLEDYEWAANEVEEASSAMDMNAADWSEDAAGEEELAEEAYAFAEAADEIASEVEIPGSDDWDLSEEEKFLAAAAAPPRADNAPDWLNAMVPGLDLDYQATEDDKPIESAYVDTPARRKELGLHPVESETEEHNADWLADLVDEETSQFQAITEEVEYRPQRRRFVFSRRPAWLRALIGQSDRTEPNPSDKDDDFELPDWLR